MLGVREGLGREGEGCRRNLLETGCFTLRQEVVECWWSVSWPLHGGRTQHHHTIVTGKPQRIGGALQEQCYTFHFLFILGFFACLGM